MQIQGMLAKLGSCMYVYQNKNATLSEIWQNNIEQHTCFCVKEQIWQWLIQNFWTYLALTTRPLS